MLTILECLSLCLYDNVDYDKNKHRIDSMMVARHDMEDLYKNIVDKNIIIYIDEEINKDSIEYHMLDEDGRYEFVKEDIRKLAENNVVVRPRNNYYPNVRDYSMRIFYKDRHMDYRVRIYDEDYNYFFDNYMTNSIVQIEDEEYYNAIKNMFRRDRWLCLI